MKTRNLITLLSALLLSSSVAFAETFEEAAQRATADYGERLRKAADELSSTR